MNKTSLALNKPGEIEEGYDGDMTINQPLKKVNNKLVIFHKNTDKKIHSASKANNVPEMRTQSIVSKWSQNGDDSDMKITTSIPNPPFSEYFYSSKNIEWKDFHFDFDLDNSNTVEDFKFDTNLPDHLFTRNTYDFKE